MVIGFGPWLKNVTVPRARSVSGSAGPVGTTVPSTVTEMGRRRPATVPSQRIAGLVLADGEGELARAAPRDPAGAARCWRSGWSRTRRTGRRLPAAARRLRRHASDGHAPATLTPGGAPPWPRRRPFGPAHPGTRRALGPGAVLRVGGRAGVAAPAVTSAADRHPTHAVADVPRDRHRSLVRPPTPTPWHTHRGRPTPRAPGPARRC